MAVRFNLTMTPALQAQIRALAPTLADPSIERVRDELWKMLAGPHPAQALTLLDDLGLLRLTLPELAACMGVTQSAPHHLDVYDHSLAVITYAHALGRWLADPTGDQEIEPTLAAMLTPWRQRLRDYFDQELSVEHSRGELLVWSALFHDVGKPRTRTEEIDPDGHLRYRFFGHEEIGAQMTGQRLEALRFSRREIGLAQKVVAAHMRPHFLVNAFPAGRISRRALFRFVRDAGTGADPDAAVDVALLALADLQATGEGAADPSWPAYLAMTDQILAYVFDERPATSQPLVDGRQVMQHLNLTPGPQVGQVMNALAEAQAVGEIGSADEALAWAERFLKG
jgi:putative nucleotidyltransferase with HDIG domain